MLRYFQAVIQPQVDTLTELLDGKKIRRIPVKYPIEVQYQPSELFSDSLKLVSYSGGVYTKEVKILAKRTVSVLWRNS